LRASGHHGPHVDKKKISTKPIKDEGDHEVAVSLGHGVQAHLKVVVQINRPKIEESEAPLKTFGMAMRYGSATRSVFSTKNSIGLCWPV
ncbi:MAG: hypothetical protein HC894_19695, partial [Microcoleus sp. SM1_3_4]|nr:hypothetical protein [Microcoleus sp. SM1_3_4]